MNPSDSRCVALRFRCLIRSARWPPHLTQRVSSTGQCVFLSMPSLLPRESTCATSVRTARARRPSPFDHRVGFSNSFTRLLIGSFALRPAHLLLGNSRPQIAPAPLPRATKAHGQFLGRDFNPLDTLLLLRTVRSCIHTFCSWCLTHRPARASAVAHARTPKLAPTTTQSACVRKEGVAIYATAKTRSPP